jgi:hypothetical protein
VSNYICLYFGNPEECQGCGGWVKADGGPFEGDPRFCSEDCAAEVARRIEAAAGRLRCCPECGFDNNEHDEGCTIAAGLASYGKA